MSTTEAENEKDPRTDLPTESGASSTPPPAEEASQEAESAATSPEAAEPAEPAEPATSEASAESAAPSATAAAEKKPASKAQAMTPGQRLAAARAAKAAKKVAERGREADEREQKAIDTAEVVREKATSYLDTHRKAIWGGIGAVVLAGAAFFGVRQWRAGQEQAAGALLDEANRIQLATIRSEAERAAGDEDEPTYVSRAARADAALEKLRAVTSTYPNSDAAVWAYLGQGGAHLDRDEPGKAREAYQKAMDAADGDASVARQALEGIGFAFEAEENWDEALRTYEELASVANGTFESWGEYHAARMLLKKGQDDQAKQRLRAVLEKLRGEDAPRSPYLQRQVEARLAVLDPTFAAQGASPGGQLTPEQLQELIQRAQQQQGQSGETP